MVHNFLANSDIEPEIISNMLLELDDLEAEFPNSKKHETEWEQRKRIADESWSAIRSNLHTCNLLKNCIPEVGTMCSLCNTSEAMLRCISCKKVLCRICDDKVHMEQPFHDREMWLNGFFQGIGSRETVVDSKICTTGKIFC